MNINPKKTTIRADSIQSNSPPILAEPSALSSKDKGHTRKFSERELLDEFKVRMATLRTGSFAGLWQEAALIIEYEGRLCDGVRDGEKCQKKLRKLQQIYMDEFDLPPTTAQRYKRVYRYFESLVASPKSGTPTMETLAEVQMSKLDLLIALHAAKPDSWHFTKDGHITLNQSVWEGSNKDVRQVSVETLRAISKALNATPAVNTMPQNVDVPAQGQTIEGNEEAPKVPTDPVPVSDVYTEPSLVPCLSDDTGTGADMGSTSDSTAQASASVDIWDEYTVSSTARDGKIRYPDSASDSGYSELVFHAFNGCLEAVYDSTSNEPELRIQPTDPECEAYAIVWQPDSGSGALSERTIIMYEPAVGSYSPACLTMNS